MTGRPASWVRRHLPFFLLLASAAGVYATTLSSYGMFMWDEAEYAAIGRSVLRGEGFAISGRANALRPPVLPLAGAAGMWLRGSADDHSAKLATLGLALLALAIVYVTAGAAFDRATALFASFLLATAPGLWTLTPHFLSEVPFLGFFAAAVLGFELGLRRGPSWFWLGWLGWALALLTRYTAVLFAPYVLLRLAAGAVLDRDAEWRRIRTPPFVLAPLLAALALSPWLVRQHQAFGSALVGFQQASQQLQVYLPGVSMPWHFYLAHLPSLLSPATTALLALGVTWAVRRREGLTLACALVIAGVLVWFSAYRYKEVRLVTSILPFAAVVAAAGVTQTLRGRWRLLLPALAVAIALWNRSLVQPVLATRVALGYPALRQALQLVRERSPEDAVVMGASVPQIAWYADRRVVDFPAPDDLRARLARCEWVVFTNFERGQKPYATDLARQLVRVHAPDDVVVVRDRRFVVLLARAAFLRRHLPRAERSRAPPAAGSGRSDLLQVPVDRAPQSLLQAGAGAKAEASRGAAGVEAPPRLAVGLAAVPLDRDLDPDQASDGARQLLDADLRAAADVHRLGRVVALGRTDDPFGGVLDVDELARRASRSPHRDRAGAPALGVDALADERRDHVRRLRIGAVARAVGVDQEERDGVEAVLLPVGRRLHQQDLLRQPVGRVGLLGIAVPQVVLAERHRRQLGVAADRADDHHLADPGAPGLVQERHAHHQVVVEELGGRGPVGADAADARRQVDEDVDRPPRATRGPRRLGEQAPRRARIAQVVLAAARRHDLRRAARAQRVDHERADEAVATGDQNPSLRPEAHRPAPAGARPGERPRIGGRVLTRPACPC
jgi:hypothetical protein